MRRTITILLWLVLILPPLILGIFILKYSVNVPYLDQWAIARILIKVSDGTITFQDLIAPYFEHRMFFPRLIIIALAWLTKWNVRYEMLISFALAGLISFNLFRLSIVSLGKISLVTESKNSEGNSEWFGVGGYGLIGLGILSNLLIFSPIQWENWLMGMYFKYFIPIACISSGILIGYSTRKINFKLLWCSVLAAIATFSIGNGMLCWLVLFPVLFPTRQEVIIHKKQALVWGLGFLACLSFYLYDFHSPIREFSPFYVASHPLAALHFLTALLGTPFAFGNAFPTVTLSTCLGSGILFLLVLASVYIYHSGEVLWRKSMGWIAIAAYAVMSDSIIVLGRVYFGIEQANTSRYTTFSIYGTVALSYLLAIVFERHLSNWLGKGISALLAILLFSHAQTFAFSIQKMASIRISRLQGKACLMAIAVLVQEDCLKTHINPKLSVIKERVGDLNRLEFIQPPLLSSPDLNQLMD